MGAPFERGACRRVARDPSGDCQRSWRAPGVGGAHGSGAAAVVASDHGLVDMVRVLQAEAQAGVRNSSSWMTMAVVMLTDLRASDPLWIKGEPVLGF